MLKEMKPGRHYLIVNIDEPYAEDVYEIIKHGQLAKDDPAAAWPEGDISFQQFLADAWPSDERANAAWWIGQRWRDEHYSLLLSLRTRLAAAEAEVERLRGTVKTVAALDPSTGGWIRPYAIRLYEIAQQALEPSHE